jgi:hypothetical protein
MFPYPMPNKLAVYCVDRVGGAASFPGLSDAGENADYQRVHSILPQSPGLPDGCRFAPDLCDGAAYEPIISCALSKATISGLVSLFVRAISRSKFGNSRLRHEHSRTVVAQKQRLTLSRLLSRSSDGWEPPERANVEPMLSLEYPAEDAS